MSEPEAMQVDDHIGKWRCIYCQQFFPHIVSASSHYDECTALKERIAALVAKAETAGNV